MAIANYEKSNLIISGGTIKSTESNAIIHSSIGYANVTGGTINGYTNGIKLEGRATLTLGVKDATVSSTTPSITGNSGGIYINSNTATFNYYDGIITGKNGAGSAITGQVVEPADVPDGYSVLKTVENGVETAVLAKTSTLTINPNGGTYSGNTTVTQASGSTYSIPNNPTKTGYVFNGWTLSNGGEHTYYDDSVTPEEEAVYNYDSATSTVPESIGYASSQPKMVEDDTATGGYSLKITPYSGTTGAVIAGIKKNILPTTPGRINVVEIKAKIPVGYDLVAQENSTAAGRESERLYGVGSAIKYNSIAGTGDWETYKLVIYSGNAGPIDGYIYLRAKSETSMPWNINSIVVKSYTKEQFKTMYTFGEEDGTLTANWSVGGALLEFDANGGTFDKSSVGPGKNGYSVCYINGSNYVLATRYATYNQEASGPGAYHTQNSGKTLVGWYTEADGGTKVFNSDGSLVPSVSGFSDSDGKWIKDGANVRLYAHWLPSLMINSQSVNGGHYGSNCNVSYTGASNGSGEYAYDVTGIKIGNTEQNVTTGTSDGVATYTAGGLTLKGTTISGTPTQAGDYTFSVTVTDVNTGLTTNITITVSIYAAFVSIPGPVSGLVYDGTEKTGVIETDEYTVTGNTGTNAGSYTATATLKDTSNYMWADGYRSPRSVPWSIGKATVTAPTTLDISTAGIVTFSGATNATGYQINVSDAGSEPDDSKWETITSGSSYLNKITETTGEKTVYVRAINSDTANYTTPSTNKITNVTVYTVTRVVSPGTSLETGGITQENTNVLKGTVIYCTASALSGYSNPALQVTIDGVVVTDWGYITVTGNTIIKSALYNYAEINRTGAEVKYYVTLNDAFSGVEPGNGIKVLNDVTESETAVLNGDVSLILNGHQIMSSAQIAIENNGSLYFYNRVGICSVVSEGYGIYNNSSGIVTIDGYNTEISGSVGIYNSVNGVVNIDSSSAKVTGTEAEGIINKGTLTMDGGTISGATDGILNEGTLTIEEGTISGAVDGMKLLRDSTATIRRQHASGSTNVNGSVNGINIKNGATLTMGFYTASNHNSVNTAVTGNSKGIYMESDDATFNYYEGVIESSGGEGTAIYGGVVDDVPSGYTVTRRQTGVVETATLIERVSFTLGSDRMKQLAGNASATVSSTDTTITSFEYSETIPEQYMKDEYNVSDNHTPIYLWYDNGAIKWWSEDKNPYFRSAKEMFRGCQALTNVDLSGFDWSLVEDMSYMFYNCGALENIDLSGMDTLNVTNMTGMFDNCIALKNINLSGMDTSKVTSMSYMFYNCRALENINLSGIDISKVEQMQYMFSGCTALENINLSWMNNSNGINAYSMFKGCSALQSIDLSELDTLKGNMSYMFSGCTALENIDLSEIDNLKVTNMSYMFSGCTALENIDLSELDTSKVTNMSYMFSNCTALKNIDLSGLNTSNVTDMGGMFSGCTAIENINLSGIDTSKVTNMSSMFSSCTALENIDLSELDTSRVTNMGSMFFRCTAIENIDLSGIGTSKVTNMYRMFYECTVLENIDLSEIDTSKVTNMSYMFYNCTNLTTIYVGKNWRTDKVTSSNNMFYGCTNLVGGAGTVFGGSYIDKQRAHIDEGTSNPGYLTSGIKKNEPSTVVYLDGNNNNNSTHSASTTTWKDLSGNNKHGTVTTTGSGDLWGDNYFNCNGLDSYVTIDNSTGQLNSNYETLEVTFECTVDTDESAHYIIGNYQSSGGMSIYLSASGYISGYAYVNGTSVSVNSGVMYNKDQIYHVALKSDGTNLTIYVNGVNKNSTSASGTISGNTCNIAIGGRIATGGTTINSTETFTGKVYSLAVYSSALEAEKITAHANATLAEVGATPEVSGASMAPAMASAPAPANVATSPVTSPVNATQPESATSKSPALTAPSLSPGVAQINTDKTDSDKQEVSKNKQGEETSKAEQSENKQDEEASKAEQSENKQEETSKGEQSEETKPIEAEEKYIAQVADTKYTSLQTAIDACENNGKVTILENISLDKEITINANKTITIELNNKTITSSAINTIINKGTLTIKSSGILKNETDNGSVINNSGELTIDKAVITTANNGGKIINNDGKLEMLGGKIVNEGIGGICIYNNTGAETVITGGIIETRGFGSKGIYNNASVIIGKATTSSEETGAKSELNASSEFANGTKPSFVVSGDDSIGIYNAKVPAKSTDKQVCTINQADIWIQADKIENYDLIKNTKEFQEELAKMKASYGIYNDAETNVVIENATIRVERLKGVGIANNYNGSVIFGKDDVKLSTSTPIIYAIADNTTAIVANSKAKEGSIEFYDGRFITLASIKTAISKVLADYEIWEQQENNLLITILKKVEIKEEADNTAKTDELKDKSMEGDVSENKEIEGTTSEEQTAETEKEDNAKAPVEDSKAEDANLEDTKAKDANVEDSKAENTDIEDDK